MLKIMGKKIFTFLAEQFCLSKPVYLNLCYMTIHYGFLYYSLSVERGLSGEKLVSGHSFYVELQENLCKTDPLKKTENWFSRPIVAKCRSKLLQNVQRYWSILQYCLYIYI